MPFGASRLPFLAKTADAVAAGDTLDAVAIPASTNYANTSVSFGGSGQNLTISFWFKGNTDPANYSRFVSIRNGSTNTYFTVMRDNSNQKLSFYSSNAGTSPNVRWWFTADVGSNMFDGNWHHIMVATDISSTSNSRIFWDGQSKTITHNNTNSSGAINWSSYDNIGIGGRAAGTNRIQGDYAQFFIDDIYENDITKFYDTTNNKAYDLGTNGRGSGLDQPRIFHRGNTSTFTTNNGTDSYTLSTVGSGTITDATGPDADYPVRPTSTWSNGAWSTTTGKFDTGFTMTNNSSPGSVTLPTGYELDDDQTITVEFWFKASLFGDSGTNSTKIFSTAPIDDNSYETASGHITIHIWNGALYLNGNQSTETTLASAGSGSGSTWYHIALQYNSTNNLRVWLDGVHKASVTHNCNGFSTLYWGNKLSGQGSQSGTNHIDEIRISNVNRYTHSTTNFTAPSSQFTNDSDTIGLFHCETTTQTDDAPIAPARSSAAVRSVDLGGTSVSSTGGKFNGAASGGGDASDYITTNPTGSWTLDSDQVWTVEFFFKTSSSFSPTSNIALAGLNFGNISGIRLEANTNGQLKAMVGGSSNSHSFNHSTSYQHLAWVSDGAGTVKFYLDGTEQISVGSYSYNMSSPTDKRFYYGSASGQSGQPTYSFDELRISRVQRYTSGFTPTTTAFTNDDDTLALFHFDNNYDDDNS